MSAIAWTDEELAHIGAVEELRLASRRADGSYHAKYDRYGPRIVGSVVGPAAHAVTVRLVPTTDTPSGSDRHGHQ